MVKLGSHQSYSARSTCHLQNVTSTPDLQKNSVIVVTFFFFYFIESLGYWIELKALPQPTAVFHL